MMKIVKKLFDSVTCIELPKFDDNRGSFIKCYDETSFTALGLSFCFKESYFSISNKNVIRGMHFQIPPADHEKLVCVTHGAIRDVILDLRKESPMYGQAAEMVLSADNHYALHIPKGFAHGFLCLEDHTIMNYLVGTVHDPQYDMSIRWDSFGYDWHIDAPILSQRDKDAQRFEAFNSPF